MSYLLAGAPRCGKSTLRHDLSRRRNLPSVSTDLLRGVLMMVVPELREAMHANDPEREAEVFYPHLRQTVACSRIQLPHQLIEGVGFFPRHVAKLRLELSDAAVRCCFLGHTSPRPEDLSGGETNHRIYDTLDHAARTQLAENVAAWSCDIRQDSAAYGLPFVDLAEHPFPEALQRAERHLLASG